jgi:superfamily II helicase
MESGKLLEFQKAHEHTKFAKLRPVAEAIDYQMTDEMGDLLIPAFLQHSYLTDPAPIQVLRPWQRNLLQCPEWEAGQNCVAVAPTSGSKTLIAEVAIGQLLEQDPRAKAIYSLPFVALAAEKCDDFQRRFPQYSVQPFPIARRKERLLPDGLECRSSSRSKLPCWRMASIRGN